MIHALVDRRESLGTRLRGWRASGHVIATVSNTQTAAAIIQGTGLRRMLGSIIAGYETTSCGAHVRGDADGHG